MRISLHGPLIFGKNTGLLKILNFGKETLEIYDIHLLVCSKTHLMIMANDVEHRSYIHWPFAYLN